MKVMQLTMGILAMGFFASGIAMAQNSLDIEQTGDVNILDVIQDGDNNLIVGADALDGSINNTLAAQQINNAVSGGENSLTIKQTGGNNQLGFYQEGNSATTSANIKQLGGDNDLGVHVVVTGGFVNNLTVTQDGDQSLKIKEVINTKDYNVTVTQSGGITTTVDN